MPPLKLWLDEVLAFGWAYGPAARRCRGKDLWLALSTGGRSIYSPEGELQPLLLRRLPAADEQTAALCGMRFLPPLVLHAPTTRWRSRGSPSAPCALYAERLARHPDWPELADLRRRPSSGLRGAGGDARPQAEQPKWSTPG